jgi:predicted TIM-barrel fold metal-dependent hydrolase
MIIDSHTHAWPRWPYQPPVPDDESRGKIEQLLFEMDQHGVDKAVIICARIDRNSDNNDYIAECVKRYPERIIQFADVDCSWTDTYHTPGAAERLAAAAEKYQLKGYTHYLRGDDNCDWFFSDEGQRFFQKTADLGLIASVAMGAHQQAPLRKLAKQFPSIPFICHHMSGARAGEAPPHPRLKEILASASTPNIYIKISGFAYVSQVPWDYPYSDAAWIVRSVYEHFGPGRLCWGSDYPVVRRFMTYQHALEAFRTHCTFIPEADKAQILGGTLERLLAEARKV